MREKTQERFWERGYLIWLDIQVMNWHNITCPKMCILFVEKRTDTNGRVYFVHHPTRTTHWEDPRTQGWVPIFFLYLFCSQYRHTFCMGLLNLVLFNVTADISQTLQCTQLGTLSLCLNLKINTPEHFSFPPLCKSEEKMSHKVLSCKVKVF